ncbi:MAG: hypothetical protein QG641_605, partial [Candidatus Poribacteria bacterium]|nr:hypothetical protein [Candidatus Poribacteria bacterium]
KNSVSLSNSSTFEYINGGINGGADLVYLEAGTGLTCSNSVQWRGFVYAPNGDVNFSNATSLTGAVYSTKRVMFANSTVATYVAPKYIDSGNSQNLLPLKFY